MDKQSVEKKSSEEHESGEEIEQTKTKIQLVTEHKQQTIPLSVTDIIPETSDGKSVEEKSSEEQESAEKSNSEQKLLTTKLNESGENNTSTTSTIDDDEEVGLIISNLNNKNYPIIEEFITTNSSCPNFNRLIEIIIQSVYKRSKNIENILWLAENLPSAEQKVLVFENLWKQIQENHDQDTYQTVELGCYIQLHMCECNSDNLHVLERYEFLKDKLPEIVQKMFWDTVCINNLHYNEYLYTDEEKYDSDRRIVFTWRKRKPDTNLNHWVIEENNRCKSFLVSNTNKEYLYGASDGYSADALKRRVFAWVPGHVVKQGNWQLEPLKDEKMIFRIKNVHHNEYLYADKNYERFDSKRRSVFVGNSSEVPYGKWEIKIC
jgi:hypothetical protein